MNQNPNELPLTPDEADKLLRVLHFIANRFEALVGHGCLTEATSDDERVHQSERKIDNLEDQLVRERQRLRRVKAWLQHRRKLQRRVPS